MMGGMPNGWVGSRRVEGTVDGGGTPRDGTGMAGRQAKPARQVDLNIVLLDCRRAFLLRASVASVGKACR